MAEKMFKSKIDQNLLVVCFCCMFQSLRVLPLQLFLVIHATEMAAIFVLLILVMADIQDG